MRCMPGSGSWPRENPGPWSQVCAHRAWGMRAGCQYAAGRSFAGVGGEAYPLFSKLVCHTAQLSGLFNWGFCVLIEFCVVPVRHGTLQGVILHRFVVPTSKVSLPLYVFIPWCVLLSALLSLIKYHCNKNTVQIFFVWMMSIFPSPSHPAKDNNTSSSIYKPTSPNIYSLLVWNIKYFYISHFGFHDILCRPVSGKKALIIQLSIWQLLLRAQNHSTSQSCELAVGP